MPRARGEEDLVKIGLVGAEWPCRPGRAVPSVVVKVPRAHALRCSSTLIGQRLGLPDAEDAHETIALSRNAGSLPRAVPGARVGWDATPADLGFDGLGILVVSRTREAMPDAGGDDSSMPPPPPPHPHDSTPAESSGNTNTIARSLHPNPSAFGELQLSTGYYSHSSSHVSGGSTAVPGAAGRRSSAPHAAGTSSPPPSKSTGHADPAAEHVVTVQPPTPLTAGGGGARGPRGAFASSPVAGSFLQQQQMPAQSWSYPRGPPAAPVQEPSVGGAAPRRGSSSFHVVPLSGDDIRRMLEGPAGGGGPAMPSQPHTSTPAARPSAGSPSQPRPHDVQAVEAILHDLEAMDAYGGTSGAVARDAAVRGSGVQYAPAVGAQQQEVSPFLTVRINHPLQHAGGGAASVAGGSGQPHALGDIVKVNNRSVVSASGGPGGGASAAGVPFHSSSDESASFGGGGGGGRLAERPESITPMPSRNLQDPPAQSAYSGAPPRTTGSPVILHASESTSVLLPSYHASGSHMEAERKHPASPTSTHQHHHRRNSSSNSKRRRPSVGGGGGGGGARDSCTIVDVMKMAPRDGFGAAAAASEQQQQQQQRLSHTPHTRRSSQLEYRSIATPADPRGPYDSRTPPASRGNTACAPAANTRGDLRDAALPSSRGFAAHQTTPPLSLALGSSAPTSAVGRQPLGTTAAPAVAPRFVSQPALAEQASPAAAAARTGTMGRRQRLQNGHTDTPPAHQHPKSPREGIASAPANPQSAASSPGGAGLGAGTSFPGHTSHPLGARGGAFRSHNGDASVYNSPPPSAAAAAAPLDDDPDVFPTPPASHHHHNSATPTPMVSQGPQNPSTARSAGAAAAAASTASHLLQTSSGKPYATTFIHASPDAGEVAGRQAGLMRASAASHRTHHREWTLDVANAPASTHQTPRAHGSAVGSDGGDHVDALSGVGSQGEKGASSFPLHAPPSQHARAGATHDTGGTAATTIVHTDGDIEISVVPPSDPQEPGPPRRYESHASQQALGPPSRVQQPSEGAWYPEKPSGAGSVDSGGATQLPSSPVGVGLDDAMGSAVTGGTARSAIYRSDTAALSSVRGGDDAGAPPRDLLSAYAQQHNNARTPIHSVVSGGVPVPGPTAGGGAATTHSGPMSFYPYTANAPASYASGGGGAGGDDGAGAAPTWDAGIPTGADVGEAAMALVNEVFGRGRGDGPPAPAHQLHSSEALHSPSVSPMRGVLRGAAGQGVGAAATGAAITAASIATTATAFPPGSASDRTAVAPGLNPAHAAGAGALRESPHVTPRGVGDGDANAGLPSPQPLPIAPAHSPPRYSRRQDMTPIRGGGGGGAVVASTAPLPPPDSAPRSHRVEAVASAATPPHAVRGVGVGGVAGGGPRTPPGAWLQEAPQKLQEGGGRASLHAGADGHAGGGPPAWLDGPALAVGGAQSPSQQQRSTSTPPSAPRAAGIMRPPALDGGGPVALPPALRPQPQPLASAAADPMAVAAMAGRSSTVQPGEDSGGTVPDSMTAPCLPGASHPHAHPHPQDQASQHPPSLRPSAPQSSATELAGSAVRRGSYYPQRGPSGVHTLTHAHDAPQMVSQASTHSAGAAGASFSLPGGGGGSFFDVDMDFDGDLELLAAAAAASATQPSTAGPSKVGAAAVQSGDTLDHSKTSIHPPDSRGMPVDGGYPSGMPPPTDALSKPTLTETLSLLPPRDPTHSIVTGQPVSQAYTSFAKASGVPPSAPSAINPPPRMDAAPAESTGAKRLVHESCVPGADFSRVNSAYPRDASGTLEGTAVNGAADAQGASGVQSHCGGGHYSRGALGCEGPGSSEAWPVSPRDRMPSATVPGVSLPLPSAMPPPPTAASAPRSPLRDLEDDLARVERLRGLLSTAAAALGAPQAVVQPQQQQHPQPHSHPTMGHPPEVARGAASTSLHPPQEQHPPPVPAEPHHHQRHPDAVADPRVHAAAAPQAHPHPGGGVQLQPPHATSAWSRRDVSPRRRHAPTPVQRGNDPPAAPVPQAASAPVWPRALYVVTPTVPQLSGIYHRHPADALVHNLPAWRNGGCTLYATSDAHNWMITDAPGTEVLNRGWVRSLTPHQSRPPQDAAAWEVWDDVRGWGVDARAGVAAADT